MSDFEYHANKCKAVWLPNNGKFDDGIDSREAPEGVRAPARGHYFEKLAKENNIVLDPKDYGRKRRTCADCDVIHNRLSIRCADCAKKWAAIGQKRRREEIIREKELAAAQIAGQTPSSKTRSRGFGDNDFFFSKGKACKK